MNEMLDYLKTLAQIKRNLMTNLAEKVQSEKRNLLVGRAEAYHDLIQEIEKISNIEDPIFPPKPPSREAV